MSESRGSAKRELVQRLRIRTNPDFDVDGDPNQNEFAYVNPVALNNDLIKLSNEMLTLTEAHVEAVKAIQHLKLQKRKEERRLEDAEESLLRDDALSPSEAKSNKTIAAATARRAKNAGVDKEIAAARDLVRSLEDKIEVQEAVIRTAKLYYDVAETITENIKTHLSWVKDSKKHGF